MSDQIPRRSRMDQWVPAEHAIRAAMLAVEEMAADVRLTRAVDLLGKAKDSVADYVDGVTRDEEQRRVRAAFAPGWLRRVAENLRRETEHWPAWRKRPQGREPT